MNQIIKTYFCLAILLSTAAVHAVVPYIPFRSESVSSDRDLVGETQFIKIPNQEEYYGAFALTLEYQQSFKSGRLGRAYFGPSGTNSDDNCDTYTISGTQVPNRGPTDWLADYFGLDPAFQGKFTIAPKVKTVTLDANLFLSLDEWYDNLYLKIHLPFVHVKTNMHFKECMGNYSGVGYPPGYFADNGNPDFATPGGNIPTSSLNQSFADFIVHGEDLIFNGISNTVEYEGLENAKIALCGKSKSGVAEIRAELGRNFLLDEDYHLSIGFLMSIPTGERPKGRFVFEPMIGNGKHWELGGAFSTHYTFWRNSDETSSCGLYLDANITSVLSGRETRTFDLKGKPLSRYMLAEKMRVGTNNNLFIPTTAAPSPTVAATNQFINIFTPVANITTQEVKVSRAVQADMTILFNYTQNNWSFDFGYNLWAATCEKIKLPCNNCISTCFEENTWALKGDAAVYAFDQDAEITVALSATESQATIYSGTNNLTDFSQGYVNTGVDFPITNIQDIDGNDLTTLPSGGINQSTSYRSVLFGQDDLDLESARVKSLTNKVFAHISHAWNNLDNDWEWIPFLGIGANAEFAQNNDNGDDCCGSTPTPATTCTGCQRFGITQWGIWIKGGFSF